MQVLARRQRAAVDKARGCAALPLLLVRSCKGHSRTLLSRRCPARSDARKAGRRASGCAFRSGERECGPDPLRLIPDESKLMEKCGELVTRLSPHIAGAAW